jgi:hypothetical protein
MDKVTEKIKEHAELCNMLATEGYDVMLLPILSEVVGTLFKCLDRAAMEM